MNTKEMFKQFGLPIGYKRWCFNEKDGTQDLLIVTSQGMQRFASIKDDVYGMDWNEEDDSKNSSRDEF